MRERAVQAVYLAGLHLLAGEERLPGPVRERLLVSYCRYSGQAGHSSHLDTVCQVQSHNTAGLGQLASFWPLMLAEDCDPAISLCFLACLLAGMLPNPHQVSPSPPAVRVLVAAMEVHRPQPWLPPPARLPGTGAVHLYRTVLR